MRDALGRTKTRFLPTLRCALSAFKGHLCRCMQETGLDEVAETYICAVFEESLVATYPAKEHVANSGGYLGTGSAKSP